MIHGMNPFHDHSGKPGEDARLLLRPARPARRVQAGPRLSGCVAVRGRRPAVAAHLLGPAAARDAYRRDRPSSLQRARAYGDPGAVRRARSEIRTAPTTRLRHVADLQPRSERRQSGAGFRRQRRAINAEIVACQILKHAHLTFVALSLLSFGVRRIGLFVHSSVLENRWVKPLAHVISALLLLSGFVLAAQHVARQPTLADGETRRLGRLCGLGHRSVQSAESECAQTPLGGRVGRVRVHRERCVLQEPIGVPGLGGRRSARVDHLGMS